jgi:hypothetical protein
MTSRFLDADEFKPRADRYPDQHFSEPDELPCPGRSSLGPLCSGHRARARAHLSGSANESFYSAPSLRRGWLIAAASCPWRSSPGGGGGGGGSRPRLPHDAAPRSQPSWLIAVGRWRGTSARARRDRGAPWRVCEYGWMALARRPRAPDGGRGFAPGFATPARARVERCPRLSRDPRRRGALGRIGGWLCQPRRDWSNCSPATTRRTRDDCARSGVFTAR